MKWPRHYAAEIVELKTVEQRREAIELVPDLYKELVKTHIKIQWEKKKYAKNNRVR